MTSSEREKLDAVLLRMRARLEIVNDPYKPPELVIDQLIRLQVDTAVAIAMLASDGGHPVPQPDDMGDMGDGEHT